MFLYDFQKLKIVVNNDLVTDKMLTTFCPPYLRLNFLQFLQARTQRLNGSEIEAIVSSIGQKSYF